MANIIVVEDEKAINDLICMNIKLVGHKVTAVYDGISAVEACRTKEFDLMILDITLPKLDGYGVCQNVKEIPVIFLTARGNLGDKLKGLDLGAEDYIVKPFEMLELLARIETVLRRSHKKTEIFQLDNMSIDFEKHTVKYNNKSVSLTPQEYILLETLILNRNIALSRDKLLELAWGYDYEGDTRTVDVHIQKLRHKLGLENRIKTIFKLGYRLEV